MDNWKRNLWILWVTQIISLASFGFGLPFIPLYIQELEVMTPERLKLMTTIIAVAPGLTMGIMAPIWGHLADRYGRKLMIMRAMTFAVFIIGAMGFVTSVNQLIVLRLLQGFFTGTVTAAVAFVASNAPKDKLTYALGVITSSTFIGFSFGPFLGGLFAEVYGYRNSFILGGLLMIVGAALVLFLVKEDKTTLVKGKREKHVGFIEKYNKVIMPTVVVVLFMLFFLRISRTLFSPYVALFVESKFPTSDGVALTTGIVNGMVGLSTAASSMIMGMLASKINKMRLLQVLLLSGTFVMVLITQYTLIADKLGVSNDLWVFVAMYMVFFFIVGGVEPILTSSSAMVVESGDRGALFGLQGMVGSFAWFVAPLIGGPVAIAYEVESVLFFIPIVLFINFVISFKLKKLV